METKEEKNNDVFIIVKYAQGETAKDHGARATYCINLNCLHILRTRTLNSKQCNTIF